MNQSPTHPPFLRNVHNGRVFRYSEQLAQMSHLVPCWSESGEDQQPVVIPPTQEMPLPNKGDHRIPPPPPPGDLKPSTLPPNAEPLEQGKLNQGPVKMAPEDPNIDLDPNNKTIETMHWTQLKKRVEALGQRYTSRADAIAFLNSQEQVA